MLTVCDDLVRVDSDLAAGLLRCPGCGGVLRRWGWAMVRTIREGRDADAHPVAHRPRRSRCAGCGVTHVLLSVRLAARRADAAEEIASAITAKVADGRGHRPIAVWLGRPASTVRGWLRSFAASAAPVAEAIAGLLARDAADAAKVWPAPVAAPAGRTVAVLRAYAEVLSARLGIATLAWHTVGLAVAGPWLFSRCWSGRVGQHQLTLTPGPLLPAG